ncbi:efflux RND transporter permease subunit [Rhodanobacter lindaniclasticus]
MNASPAPRWSSPWPSTGSSAATVVIFLPLAFLSGVTGAFFKALSLTMASALVISYLLTWVAVPLLAERFLDQRHLAEHTPSRFATRVMDGYQRVLDRWLKRPVRVLLLLVPLLLVGGFAYTQRPPVSCRRWTRVASSTAPRPNPAPRWRETNSSPEPRSRRSSAPTPGSTPIRGAPACTGARALPRRNGGDLFVRLKNGSRPSTEEVMTQVRTAVERQVPGLDIDLAQLMEDLIGDLVAVPQPIEVQLYGDDPEQLNATAGKVAAAIGKITGVVGVLDGINPAGDALTVQVDPARAALQGLDPDRRPPIRWPPRSTAPVATQIAVAGKVVGVRVRLPDHAHQRLDQVAALPIRAADGHLFPLSQVATLRQVQGQPQITRDNLKRMVAVTGRISGRSLGAVMATSSTRWRNRPCPAKATAPHQLGGVYQQQQQAFRGLTLVMLAAIALVFTLLLFLYESFRVALAILAMPLLALPGVFAGSRVHGIERHLLDDGHDDDRGHRHRGGDLLFLRVPAGRTGAGRHPARGLARGRQGDSRTRPILMSTLAAILTLLPLALALGQGLQMQQPLAVAIIAGMLLQLPLVLLVMPVLYALLRRGGRRLAPAD